MNSGIQPAFPGALQRALIWLVASCLAAPASCGQQVSSRFSDSGVNTIDLSPEAARQVVVDRQPGQYLGHPTTVLLEDGQTLLCVYPMGHGKGAVIYKRSDDGGLTWSERLPTPASWATSREVPTLHRVIDADGNKRIILFSGLYPARLAVTSDDGNSWSELNPVGDWGGIVVMGTVFELQTGPGHYMALFHDDGRFIAAKPRQDPQRTFTLYKTLSSDGGLSWSAPESILQSASHHLCEPGAIRSPDGKQLAVLLRENSRRHNSQFILSRDEGQSWSAPQPLPDVLNGDRHNGKYSSDGRLLVSFRKRSPTGKSSQFEGDWVAWVGTWDDLVGQSSGEYLVRLKQNHRDYDCAYPGVEILPDDTFVLTTYGHWQPGEQPYILSVRLRLADLDQIAGQTPSFR